MTFYMIYLKQIKKNSIYNLIISILFGIYIILAVTFMFIKMSPFIPYATLYLVFTSTNIIFDLILLFKMIKIEEFKYFKVVKLSIVYIAIGTIILAIIWLSYSKIQNIIYPIEYPNYMR